MNFWEKIVCAKFEYVNSVNWICLIYLSAIYHLFIKYFNVK